MRGYLLCTVLSNPNPRHANLRGNNDTTGSAGRFGGRPVDWQRAVVQRQELSLVVLAPHRYARPFFSFKPAEWIPVQKSYGQIAMYTNSADLHDSSMIRKVTNSFSSSRRRSSGVVNRTVSIFQQVMLLKPLGTLQKVHIVS